MDILYLWQSAVQGKNSERGNNFFGCCGRRELVPEFLVRFPLLTSDVPGLRGRIPLRPTGLDFILLAERCHKVDPRGFRKIYGSLLCGGFGVSLSGFGIHLSVEAAERFPRIVIEAGDGHLDCLEAITEDAPGGHGILEATSRNDLVHGTVEERLADDLRPLAEVHGEFFVRLRIAGTHPLDENLLLSTATGVLLLHREREAVKECFVQHVGADESSVIGALALGVGSGENGKPRRGLDESVDLLEEDALAFQHRLEAHDLVRREVDLVEKQDTTIFHGGDDRSILPHGLAVDQAETTEQVILIGLGGDVDAIQVAAQAGADLVDHRGLAVTGETGDEDGAEGPSIENRLDILVMSPRNVGRNLFGNERSPLTTGHSERHVGFGRDGLNGALRGNGDGRRGRRGLLLSSLGDECIDGNLKGFGNGVDAAGDLASRILRNPRRRASVNTSHFAHMGEILAGVLALGSASGGKGVNEAGLATREGGSGQIEDPSFPVGGHPRLTR